MSYGIGIWFKDSTGVNPLEERKTINKFLKENISMEDLFVHVDGLVPYYLQMEDGDTVMGDWEVSENLNKYIETLLHYTWLEWDGVIGILVNGDRDLSSLGYKYIYFQNSTECVIPLEDWDSISLFKGWKDELVNKTVKEFMDDKYAKELYDDFVGLKESLEDGTLVLPEEDSKVGDTDFFIEELQEYMGSKVEDYLDIYNILSNNYPENGERMHLLAYMGSSSMLSYTLGIDDKLKNHVKGEG